MKRVRPPICAQGTIFANVAVLATQLSTGKFCPLNSCSNLLECRLPGSGSVIGKGRESAVVRGSESFDRQEGCRFKDAIANLGRSLDRWIDWVDDATNQKDDPDFRFSAVNHIYLPG